MVDDGRVVVGQRVPEGLAERARDLRRSMTRAESALWQELRASRLGGRKFRRQQIIDGFIVDSYCHAAALVVEVDGGIHAQQTESDSARDDTLASRVILTLRVSNDEILHNLDAVLNHILNALASHTQKPLSCEERGWGEVSR
ncbi:MAG TPA: DUF559 domain-containing protein [Thermomicrobiales bacterium]|nr:DUF559 domain-containing protein [Thermomicrobiales bacterium]